MLICLVMMMQKIGMIWILYGKKQNRKDKREESVVRTSYEESYEIGRGEGSVYKKKALN